MQYQNVTDGQNCCINVTMSRVGVGVRTRDKN